MHGAQVHLAVSRQEFYKQNRETDEEIPLHLAMLLGEEVGPNIQQKQPIAQC